MMKKVVSATEFKAKCLSILGEVEELRESVIITRRGVAVAVLGPSRKRARKSPRDSWAGRARILGDIVMPPAPGVWDVLKDG